MYSDFHFYIDFDWEDAINKTIDVYLKELYQLVELAYQHKASVFYSKERFDEFKEIIEGDINDNFSESIGNQLDVILQNAKEKNNKAYVFGLSFDADKTTIYPISPVNNVLSVVDKHDKIAILSFSSHINPFLLVESNMIYDRLACISIPTRKDIVNWVSDIKPRTFNLNPKHGENGKGNQPNASPLLCSKHNAQTLLNTAIPCFLERGKNMYNFDDDKKTFIVFFYEGDNPLNQWHGFHLKPDEWTKEIPKYIHKYFGK
ncbi:MAG: hypothetical protein LBN93_01805 [Candidatus Symbiothrix sp.]|jgi:hypothetical protein|nr:hypothetical protein [Candidatus Symbiothrix sp.]